MFPFFSGIPPPAGCVSVVIVWGPVGLRLPRLTDRPLSDPNPRGSVKGIGRLFGREDIGGGLQHHLVRQLTEDHEVLAGEDHLVGGTEPIVELHNRDDERLFLGQILVAGGDALAEFLGELDGESLASARR